MIIIKINKYVWQRYTFLNAICILNKVIARMFAYRNNLRFNLLLRRHHLRLFFNFLIRFYRRAAAHEVAISVGIVDAAY